MWEVVQDLVRDGDVARARRFFHWLSQGQFNAALMYYGRYPDEIRAEVEANDALTPEVLQKLFPGLVHVVRVK